MTGPGMQFVSGRLLPLSSTNARSEEGESNSSMSPQGLGGLFPSQGQGQGQVWPRLLG